MEDPISIKDSNNRLNGSQLAKMKKYFREKAVGLKSYNYT